MVGARLAQSPVGGALLVLGQWLSGAVVVEVGRLVTGRPLLWPLLVSWLVAAAVWTVWARSERREQLSRAQVQRVSTASGLGTGLLMGGCWLAGALLAPQSFGPAADHLVVGTLAFSLAGALTGLALTLCGVNAVNAPWGSFNGGERT